jgi:hypothetical protein
MAAFDDAKTALETSIAANRAFLSTQDDPSTLALAFRGLATIQLAVTEWVRAAVSLRAMTAASENDFDQAIKSEAVQDLRKDAARLVSHANELQALIKAFAEKARVSPAGVTDGAESPSARASR